MEMYLPGWDPSTEPYANTTIDLSHAAIARSDVVEMAIRLGDRLRHIHLTDGTGSAKDEHLVPGRGATGADRFLAHLARTGFDGEIVVEINTRRCSNRERAPARPGRVARLRPRALRGHHAVSTTGRPAAGTAVEVRGLVVVRGGIQAVAHLDLTIGGGVTGLLGPSGCGKSTLMRAIVGVQRVTSGDVRGLRRAGRQPRRCATGSATSPRRSACTTT